jgi:hypothetical protein
VVAVAGYSEDQQSRGPHALEWIAAFLYNLCVIFILDACSQQEENNDLNRANYNGLL